MKWTQSLALLGAAFIAACSERQPTTAPTADATSLVTASSTTDRPYNWTFSCQAPNTYGSGFIYANWVWTENGVAIPGTNKQAYCSNGYGGGKATGTGLRPANANGLLACVGIGDCGLLGYWTSRTFDPSGSFKATIDGSLIAYNCKTGKGGICLGQPFTVTGTLKIDS